VDDVTVVWMEDDNLHHLLVDNADRGITPEDVEAVLMDPDTAVVAMPNGHDLYTGRTAMGYLRVIAMGEREVYPKTAWWCSEDDWREAHE
jgi:hypothetical protein